MDIAVLYVGMEVGFHLYYCNLNTQEPKRV